MTLAIANGILTEAARITRLTPDILRGKGRTLPVNSTRQAVMLALHSRTAWSLPQIGHYLGGRDHSTIIHGIRAAQIRSRSEPIYAGLIDALLNAAEVSPFEKIVIPEPEPELIEDEELPGWDWRATQHYYEDRVTLDDDGECQERRIFLRGMVFGSAQLAAAIQMARVA
jgi:hypothetical protein